MKYLIIAVTFVISNIVFSYNDDFGKKNNTEKHINKSGCVPPSQTTWLQFNDVHAMLRTGGILFLDVANNLGTYEVPKGGGTTAIFAASIWMGGVDVNNQLKLAAERYTANGFDFWTGPLTATPGSGNYDPKNPVGDNAIKDFGDANIGADECAAYDKFFTIRKAEVIGFSTWWEACKGPKTNADLCATITAPSNEVLNRIYAWPAHGDETLKQDHYLAPFYDNPDCKNGKNGWYDPLNDGDYPWYDDILKKNDIVCGSDRRISLFGDETNWWIFNDKGNIHTETGGDPIGMEIRAQAFTFATTDEINSMTFYNYEMINRGTQTLYNTYFSQYVDSDLGNPYDDYVGCDVTRGLGYDYNGDNFDEDWNGKKGYGANPPAIGVDFFEGPYQDADGIDNPGPQYDSKGKLTIPTVLDAIANKGIVYDGLGIGYGDGIIDNERNGMKRFTYYTNNAPISQSDPQLAVQYYNYMQGKWCLGDKTMFGGSGFPGSNNVTSIPANYMFPADSDTLNWGTSGVDPGKKNWSEITENNPKGDRRFVQSAGPFTLKPGAINNITVGFVYARSTESDLFASVRSLLKADTKAQQLFDNCFQILEPPSAPKLTIQELDKELVLTLSNPSPSNNVGEKYIQKDFEIDPSYSDKYYRFEGYMIYQLKSSNVTAADIYNTDKARLAAQCDIKNGISKIINFEYDQDFGLPVPVLKVNGNDNGISHSFALNTDLFLNTPLVNNKSYYYIAVAYAYNNFKTYIPDQPGFTDGQKLPFIMSRTGYDGNSISTVVGIPHKPVSESLIQNSDYGNTPQIIRLDGKGHGSREIDLTQNSTNTILSNGKLDNPTYDYGKGPLNIKVVDPLNLANGYFECKFRNYKLDPTPYDASILTHGIDTASWVIYRYNSKDGGVLLDSVLSENTISVNNEQLIPKWGVSVQISQYQAAQLDAVLTDHFDYQKFADPIIGTIDFADSSKKWLTFVKDNDLFMPNNWIRSGTHAVKSTDNNPSLGFNNPYYFEDANYGYNSSQVGAWIDSKQLYDGLLGGGIAPHCLVGYQTEYMPLAYPSALTVATIPTIRSMASLTRTPSCDIVITSDTSKWTRCAVIELGRNTSLTEGGAEAGALRKGTSVDKLGNPIAGSTGMGWFPGYAIDVETGVRLHMAFGENSFLLNDNGRDMIWNPSSISYDDNGQPHLGGQHTIYVFGYNVNNYTDNTRNCPYYDGVNNWVYDKLMAGTVKKNYSDVYTSLVWVVNPLLSANQTLLSSDVKMSVRLSKQYKEYTATGKNNGRPMYGWSMDNIATSVASVDQQKNALSLVNVVPNPYYAYSEYETARLDTRVKITNLPAKCNINIYNLSGKLIRSYKIDHTSDNVESRVYYLDWDLKNNQAIPIASGVYLIHVEVPGVGETIVKFFGGVRQIDLENI